MIPHFIISLIQHLTQVAIDLVSNFGYPGIVAATFAENIFPPIPSEAIMPLAGYLSTTGRFNFYLAIMAGVFGSLLGAVVLYFLGLWVGDLRLRKFLEHYGRFLLTTPKDLDAAETWFNHHGEKSVFLCRMVPIVRSVISVPAGVVRMRIRRFMFLTSLGAFAWTTIEVVAGAVLGKNWYLIGPWMRRFDVVVVGVLGGLVGYYCFRKLKSMKQMPNY